MSVSPVINLHTAKTKTTADSGTGDTSSGSPEDITDSFLTLLVAQMQNQDPTNPLDNNQLTSQLAQLNTASGIRDLNTTLNQVGGLVYNMQQMNAAEWIGRKVMVEGDSTISLAADGNKDFAFALESDSDKVTVTLTDEQGNAYTADLNDLKAGVNKFSYDDLSNFQPAEPPADGVFKVTFSAANDDGTKPNVVSLKQATVDGVSFNSTGALLQLGKDGNATLGEIYQVE
ncbi:flagellar hook capping FlgD N-terminal domain-containing protein [Pantoea sp.]|uniref:flagellar hook assembly protein FlgD n=1 Tax=Pantoea sp. TaxID=69393 RepID=UPI00289B7896|nr:flagellar hook capping FlgD N-terminal domain-containing protein [Pantoea sp.]